MSEVTAKVVHPAIPGSVFTIRYVDREAILRKSAEIEQEKDPYVVLDPRSGEPYRPPIRNKAGEIIGYGEPLITWKPRIALDFAQQNILSYVVTWTGLVLGGKEIPFDKKNVGVLLNEKLDVDGVSWSSILRDKAYDVRTFSDDPNTNGSDSQ